MTLIIGVKCSDGVVVGADGAATLGNTTGQRTVVQPVSKLEVIQGHIVMGVSGPVGLSQLYCDRIDQLWRSNSFGRDVSRPDVMRLLRDAIFQDAQHAISRAAASVPFLGNNAAGIALSSSLIALPVGGTTGRPELIQCDHTGLSEAATDDLPYVAIGSGQSLADPFLAFLRHIFWPSSLPNLGQGVFATVWALDHAIRVSPGGVSEPIQVATLARQGRELIAKEFSSSDLQEHRVNIQEAESYLSRYFESTQDGTQSPPPPSPEQ